jgi:competence protein ComEA
MKLPENRTWLPAAFGVVVGAVLLAAIMLISLPDRTTPLSILPTRTAAPFQVYVTGAVNKPGVVKVIPGSRVQDALTAAGDVLPEADIQLINLASIVTDGQKIVVPIIGQTTQQKSINITLPDDNSLVMSLNNATQKDLEKLPGIGEEKAKAIIAERLIRGSFQSVDELSEITGFSEKLINQIRPYLTVE